MLKVEVRVPLPERSLFEKCIGICTEFTKDDTQDVKLPQGARHDKGMDERAIMYIHGPAI